MENFEMEWKNIVRTIKINATVEEREKIEELKKLLKEAWKEKSEYAKEVEVLKEKVFGLETNIKIIKGETIKYLDNGD
jgi:predicted nuclease with TOPRIM domain